MPLATRAGAHRRAALATGTVLLLAACTSSVVAGHGATSTRSGASARPGSDGGTGAAPPPAQPRADFQDCTSRINVAALGLSSERAHKLGFACATIDVPLDYSRPTGTKISLQLVKIHDSDDTSPTGSLLVNPGGPGVSGVNFALSLSGQLSDRILGHFDLIGFDPRGVGLSSPIVCLTDHEKDVVNAASPDVLTAAGFAEAKRTAALLAHKCEAKYGSALAQYDTVQTARDMDQIRQAVGDSRMNYLGFSYGTELGAQYVHLFPHTVRVVVLDGAVDPLTDDLTTFANQLQGFEAAFDQFAAWCAQHSPCSDLGDARQAVYRIVARAKAAPIPSSAPDDSRRATSAIVDTGVLQALYAQSLWPVLGRALLAAEHGDAKGVIALADQYNERFDGHYTNVAEANTAISCNDSKPGPSDATIRATAKSWARRFPMFGLWSAASLFSCQQWQPHRTVPPLPTAATASHEALVIGNLHDPATPYRGAQDLTRTLADAELLTWDGEGHTSYLEGSTCIDGYVNTYLVDGTLPPEHKTCPR